MFAVAISVALLADAQSRLINLSCRGQVGTNENVMIGGFVIGGAGTKTVLIRGVGPGLTQLQVPGVLPDPLLTIFDVHNQPIASNDNWAAADATAFATAGAFGLASGSTDAALVTTLPPGNYTAQVSGLGPINTGVGLLEIYDIGGTARLMNLSGRVLVSGGASVGIAGFVVPAAGPRKLLIRAVGPGLNQLSVTTYLPDPQLTLLDQNQNPIVTVAANASAAIATQASTEAGGFPLTADDTVLIATLQPGNYTAQVSSRSGAATGVALVEVYDISDTTDLPASYTTPPRAPAVDFGPNVVVFDSAQAAADIQARVDAIFGAQETAQFGAGRYALLFKPGTYNANVRVGYYTQVLGLGRLPDDTAINGTVSVDARWFNGNATQNFWRGAENLAVTPTGGSERWAVSQACPFRRMHVLGNMQLDDSGWSSGGFIADTKVDNRIYSGSQQQWLTRNSDLGGWTGSNWNMVFVGVAGAPSESFPNPPFVVVDQAPVVREKPYLRIDANGYYSVFVPALTTQARGTTWGGVPIGVGIPLDRFYIAQSATDTAATLNAALAAGKHLLLTPGIYHLSDTLRVTQPDTVVLGLGLATLYADNGVTAMSVADVDGVKIAGILFDAGPTSSPVLLDVGSVGSNADHSANPTSLHDVFFRVGGAAVGKADVSLRINSNNVIADDLWVWRGDHTYGVGWTVNTTTNGVVVNGANVTIYGLAVEHYHQYQTLWNGNGGRVYFYQSEAPYDVPDQASWTHDGVNGYASYKVGDAVTSHEAWGLGVYCYFSANHTVKLGSAIEAPNTPGVRFHDLTTVSLGGTGEITHVVNTTGGTANSTTNVVTLTQYP